MVTFDIGPLRDLRRVVPPDPFLRRDQRVVRSAVGDEEAEGILSAGSDKLHRQVGVMVGLVAVDLDGLGRVGVVEGVEVVVVAVADGPGVIEAPTTPARRRETPPVRAVEVPLSHIPRGISGI